MTDEIEPTSNPAPETLAPQPTAQTALQTALQILELPVEKLPSKKDLRQLLLALVTDATVGALEPQADFDPDKFAVIPVPDGAPPAIHGVECTGWNKVWVDGRAVGGWKTVREAVWLTLAIWRAVQAAETPAAAP